MHIENLKDYEEDFVRMQSYMKHKKQKPENYPQFAKSLQKIGWDMDEKGKKMFWKYQRTYLIESGKVRLKLPPSEIKVSIHGKMLARLPKIRTDGLVQRYWMLLEGAKERGYKVSISQSAKDYFTRKSKKYRKQSIK